MLSPFSLLPVGIVLLVSTVAANPVKAPYHSSSTVAASPLSTPYSNSSTVPPPNPYSNSSWPNGPFVTKSIQIVNSLGKPVYYAGVNWPGAAAVMIPEGLQYASIASTVSKIKAMNMNVIRLTYAVEMVDDIYTKGNDTKIVDALTKALGSANGNKVWAEIQKQNPEFTASSTRLDAYDAVARECAKQNIYVHLDNHISKAMWCCGNDGNAWFGDKYFDTNNWIRGWSYMAKYGLKWPNLMSVGLRNELRSPDDNPTLVQSSYNWADWYTHMTAAASAIHTANPNVLIFFGGMGYDTHNAAPASGVAMGSNKFIVSSFPYANKIVLENHLYDFSGTSKSFQSVESQLNNTGFGAMDLSRKDIANHVPVILTEFGFMQSGTGYTSVYASCLKDFIPAIGSGFMAWALAGSYYIAGNDLQDSDEPLGLLNHQWSGYRDQQAVDNYWIPFAKATLHGTT